MNANQASLLFVRLSARLEAALDAVTQAASATSLDAASLMAALQAGLAAYHFEHPGDGSTLSYHEAEHTLADVFQRLSPDTAPTATDRALLERLAAYLNCPVPAQTAALVEMVFGPVTLPFQGDTAAFQKALRTGLAQPKDPAQLLRLSDLQLDCRTEPAGAGRFRVAGRVYFNASLVHDARTLESCVRQVRIALSVNGEHLTQCEATRVVLHPAAN